MKDIFVPSFTSIEAAKAFVEWNKPFKKAHEAFQNRETYAARYGDAAANAAYHCWKAATMGDMDAMQHVNNAMRVFAN